MLVSSVAPMFSRVGGKSGGVNRSGVSRGGNRAAGSVGCSVGCSGGSLLKNRVSVRRRQHIIHVCSSSLVSLASRSSPSSQPLFAAVGGGCTRRKGLLSRRARHNDGSRHATLEEDSDGLSASRVVCRASQSVSAAAADSGGSSAGGGGVVERSAQATLVLGMLFALWYGFNI